MPAKQDIRFCETIDGVTIAYSTMGEGSPLVIPPQFLTHLEADLVEGPFGDVYEGLAQHHTVVRFDKRGTGLSEREVSGSLADENFLPDLEAVVDALGLERFALYGLSAGGRLSLHYYHKHPARVTQLVFYGSNPKAAEGRSKERQAVSLAVISASWEVGSKMLAEGFMPYGGTREDIDRLARWIRLSVNSDVVQRIIEHRVNRGDLTALLPNISVPTLVLHRRGDLVPFSGGRILASKVPGARLVALEGSNHLPATYDEAMELVIPVVEFLAQSQEQPSPQPSDTGTPLTLLFTDIEGSTSLTQRLGDEGAQSLLREHNETVRKALDAYNGKEVKHTGDGIMASFFSASRAVGCAVRIQQMFADRNNANPEDAVRVRIGVNAGEPITERDDLFGTSVQLARRLCDRAQPGTILVADVVRQLVAGKGFEFDYLGSEMLKGFDEPVPLYEVRG